MKPILKIERIILMAFFLIAFKGYAQKATEMFIPIGKSPGVSGTLSRLGTIETIDEKSYSLTMKADDGTSTALQISKRTKIYIDRSGVGQSNTSGTWKDIKPGAAIEVKYQNPNKTGDVDWIKIKADK
jgi:hypothetical protein